MLRVAFPDDRLDAVDEFAEVPARGVHVGGQPLALRQGFAEARLPLGEQEIGDRDDERGQQTDGQDARRRARAQGGRQQGRGPEPQLPGVVRHGDEARRRDVDRRRGRAAARPTER